MSEPIQVCKHGVRWPWACDDCETLAAETLRADQG